MYNHLQAFIDDLYKAGEIATISDPVSTEIEISRYTDRESKSPGGGKALYFANVKDSIFPVVTNLFGSDRRICMALGVNHLDELGTRMAQYMDLQPPRNLKEALGVIPLALDATRFFPRRYKGRTPPCQEVVHTGEAVDLSRIPVLKCWPKDGGRFVTLPLVFTKSLETGKRNVGMYRLQIYNRNTTGMHWHIHKDGSHYFSEYRKAGQRMPVAVAIGADPATIYAATAPMPRGMDETALAGFIRKKPVKMARCVTTDMEVPAEAEFVLEGFVDPDELRIEGPFGDHTGYYSLADNYPVFHLTAITHRREPVYSATLVGRPPMEDCYLAKATERLFLPMLRAVFPEITDYWLPWEGVFHNIVIVAIEKAYPGHAQKIMSGLWGQGQMSFCKMIVVVDRHVDPKSPQAVLKALVDHLDVTRDLTVTKGVLDVLDHSAPQPNFGHKLGIDLTARFPGEPGRGKVTLTDQPFGDKEEANLCDAVENVGACLELLPELTQNHQSRHRILALTITKSANRGGNVFADELFKTRQLLPFSIILLYDANVDLTDHSLILWKLFNNVDPARDLFFKGSQVFVDACKKGPMDGHTREWPEDVTFDV